jgi:hypothetical protein
VNDNTQEAVIKSLLKQSQNIGWSVDGHCFYSVT